jgi:tetratricopeptide (TPR) repeat protein
MIGAFLLTLTLLAAPAPQSQTVRATLDATADPLIRARTLYGAAQYEDALASLPTNPEHGQEDDVDRYRMLCLLALGRTAEAEQAVERALTRNPTFSVFETEVSPRVTEFFRDIRKRVLPLRAESLYLRGRADYEDRHYVDAVTKFTMVLELLSDPEVASTGKLADLRLVTEEFRKLARERLPESLRSDASIGLTNGGEYYAADRIYTRLSANVTAPVELSREMPAWNPPPDQAWRTFRGVIEVTIDARGRVEDARMIERLAPFYDTVLVDAARRWVFKPAIRAGQAVRFRKEIEIVMRPAN